MSLIDEILENHGKKDTIDLSRDDDAGCCWRCNSQWSEPEICTVCEACPDCCECEGKEK